MTPPMDVCGGGGCEEAIDACCTHAAAHIRAYVWAPLAFYLRLRINIGRDRVSRRAARAETRRNLWRYTGARALALNDRILMSSHAHNGLSSARRGAAHPPACRGWMHACVFIPLAARGRVASRLVQKSSAALTAAQWLAAKCHELEQDECWGGKMGTIRFSFSAFLLGAL
jgi:hypothetical protein